MLTVTKKGDFKFDAKLKEALRTKSKLPTILANTSLNHFLEGFRNGGGQTDASKGGWKKRFFTSGSKGRKTLVKSGILRRSIMVRSAYFSRIVINTGSLADKYASIHNEGGNIPVTAKMLAFFYYKSQDKNLSKAERSFWKTMSNKKSHVIKMPKREFIGRSNVLSLKLQVKINQAFLPILKKLK